MDDQLKRAEAYYLVAAELRENAQRMIETSMMLGTMADRICEENMRRNATPSPNPTRGSPPFPEVEAAGGGSDSPDVIRPVSATGDGNG